MLWFPLRYSIAMGCSHLGTSTSFKHFGLSFLFCLKFKIFLYFKIHCMHSHILAERLHFGSGGESIDQMTWTDWSNDVNRLNISTNSLNIFDSHVFCPKGSYKGWKFSEERTLSFTCTVIQLREHDVRTPTYLRRRCIQRIANCLSQIASFVGYY